MSMEEEEYESSEPGFYNPNELRECLDAWFSSSAPKGVIMSSSTYSSSPNPVIKVTDAGIIGLPLSSRDTLAVKQASHAAPFGKGTETIIDESIRKTWEINAADITFGNPEWDLWVQKSILPICPEKLAIPLSHRPYMRADSNKMLLYEEGAHFKPHRDSEKAPGMFATLAICLPTEHSGGQLVLNHGHEQLAWDSSKSSLSDVSIAAWYADVTHEVKPVTAGHRLDLTYNVINAQPTAMTIPTASDLSQSDRDLTKILTRWESEESSDDFGDAPDFLCYIMDHKYTEESLRLSRLAGKDQSVVAQAARVAERTNFMVYLATFQCTVSGQCDENYGHAFQDEVESDWEIEKMVDLKGVEVARDIEIDEKHIVQSWSQYEKNSDEEDYEGHTGNAGAQKTLWYRKAVVVLMPKSKYVGLAVRQVIKGKTPGEPLANQLLETFKADPGNALAKADLYTFCKMLASKMETEHQDTVGRGRWYGSIFPRPFTDSLKAILIICCAWLEKSQLCEKILPLMDGPVPVSVFKELREPLHGKFSQFRPFLTSALGRMNSIADIWEAIDCFAELSKDDSNEEVVAWAAAVARHFTLCQTILTAADARTSLMLTRRYGAKFYLECVFLRAQEKASQAWFSLTLAEELFDFAQSGGLPSEELHPQDLESNAMSLMATALHGFKAAQLSEKVVSKKPVYSMDFPGSTPASEDQAKLEQDDTPEGEKRILHFINPATLANLCRHLVRTDKSEFHDSMLVSFLKSARGLAVEAPSLHPRLLLPFAARYLEIADDPLVVNSFPPNITASDIRVMFNSAWIYSLVYYLGPKPAAANYTMPTVRCSCNDCIKLNVFLKDGRQTQLRYPAGKNARQHLHNQLDINLRNRVTHETERNGKMSVQPLVITKKSGSQHKEVMTWAYRAVQLRKAITAIPLDRLKGTLSREFFHMLPEATMKAMLGESFEAIWRLCPPATADPELRSNSAHPETRSTPFQQEANAMLQQSQTGGAMPQNGGGLPFDGNALPRTRAGMQYQQVSGASTGQRSGAYGQQGVGVASQSGRSSLQPV